MYLKNNASCHNEYDRLKEVIVTSPRYMRIEEVINETQKYYQATNIDTEKAVEQHHHFIEIMKSHGVDIIEIEPDSTLNEQVFTRDIGVTIGNQIFVGQMATDLRKRESRHLQDLLIERSLPHIDIQVESIEGGDVIIDGKIIWVGLSERTTEQAASALQQILPDYKIETIQLADQILHLDCTFNLVSDEVALIYQDGMAKEDYEKLKSRYQLIHVNENEQFTLGTNVLSIEAGKVISLPENKQTNQNLRDAGFEVIEVPFDEIIKSGGSFRCCTMPVRRGK